MSVVLLVIVLVALVVVLLPVRFDSDAWNRYSRRIEEFEHNPHRDAEARTALAVAEYLDRSRRHTEWRQRHPYVLTHQRWDHGRAVCVACGHSAVEIHLHQIRCVQSMQQYQAGQPA